jgi:hypothetical protein
MGSGFPATAAAPPTCGSPARCGPRTGPGRRSGSSTPKDRSRDHRPVRSGGHRRWTRSFGTCATPCGRSAAGRCSRSRQCSPSPSGSGRTPRSSAHFRSVMHHPHVEERVVETRELESVVRGDGPRSSQTPEEPARDRRPAAPLSTHVFRFVPALGRLRTGGGTRAGAFEKSDA